MEGRGGLNWAILGVFSFDGRATQMAHGVCRHIAGFAKWQFPCTLTPEQAEEKAARDKEPVPSFPEGENRDVVREFFAQVRAKREKWNDPEKDYCRFFSFRAVLG